MDMGGLSNGSEGKRGQGAGRQARLASSYPSTHASPSPPLYPLRRPLSALCVHVPQPAGSRRRSPLTRALARIPAKTAKLQTPMPRRGPRHCFPARA